MFWVHRVLGSTPRRIFINKLLLMFPPFSMYSLILVKHVSMERFGSSRLPTLAKTSSDKTVTSKSIIKLRVGGSNPSCRTKIFINAAVAQLVQSSKQEKYCF